MIAGIYENNAKRMKNCLASYSVNDTICEKTYNDRHMI